MAAVELAGGGGISDRNLCKCPKQVVLFFLSWLLPCNPQPIPCLAHKQVSLQSWGEQGWCHWTKLVIHLGQFPSLFFCVVAHMAVLVKGKLQLAKKMAQRGTGSFSSSVSSCWLCLCQTKPSVWMWRYTKSKPSPCFVFCRDVEMPLGSYAKETQPECRGHYRRPQVCALVFVAHFDSPFLPYLWSKYKPKDV